MEKAFSLITGFLGGLAKLFLAFIPVTILWSVLTGGTVFGMDVIANLTALVILLFLGKFLWNNYLTKLVTVVNPVESVFDLLALSILLNLLVGN